MNIIQKIRVSYYALLVKLYRKFFIYSDKNKNTGSIEGASMMIFYNMADVDSVISANILLDFLRYKHPNGKITAVAATNRIPIIYDTESVVYYWLGVIPSQKTVRYLNNQSSYVFHYVFGGKKHPIHHSYLSTMSSAWMNSSALPKIDDKHEDLLDDEIIKKCLTTIYADMLLVMDDVETNEPYKMDFNLASLIYRFNYDKYLSSEDQKYVIHRYYKALNNLNNQSKWNEQIVDGTYERDISYVKGTLSRLFDYTSFKLDGEICRLPLINLDQKLQPLAKRILMQTYDHFVLFEQQGQQSVYTPYSALAGFDDYILKNLDNRSKARLCTEM